MLPKPRSERTEGKIDSYLIVLSAVNTHKRPLGKRVALGCNVGLFLSSDGWNWEMRAVKWEVKYVHIDSMGGGDKQITVLIVVLGVFGSHRTPCFQAPSSCFQWWWPQLKVGHMWDKSGVFVSRLLAFFSQWPRNVILPAAVALGRRGQNSQKSNLGGGWDDLQRFQQKNSLWSG